MRNIMLPAFSAMALALVAAPLTAQTETAPAYPVVQANPVGSNLPPTMTAPNPASASSEVQPAMPADPAYGAGPYKGALTPPPAAAMSKAYPVCTSKIQDSCQNPGEGGAPGRSRAVDRKRSS